MAGVSHGGLVALEMAFAHAAAVRGGVGVGAFYTNDARSDAVFRSFGPDRIDPAWAAELARRHDPHHVPGHWRDLMRWMIASATAPRSYGFEDLAGVAVPTMWIAGEDDALFELDQLLTMKRRIPGAEILVVNHAAHQTQMTHPHLVGPAIADFLARTGGR